MAPIDLTALYRDGMAAQQAGRIDEALAIYDRILALKPDIPEVLFQKGRCLAPSEPKKAAKAFRAALDLRPKEAAIWQGLHAVLDGRPREKLEDQAARAGIIIGSERDISKARRYWREGDTAKAEAEALRIAKAAPQAFWPAYMLGLCRTGAAALGPLEAAHARDPNHSDAAVVLAQTLAQLGQVSRAETLLRNLPRGEPSGAEALADVMRRTARPELAVKLLQKLVKKRPRYFKAHADLALALAELGDGQAARAAASEAERLMQAPGALHRDVALALEEAGAVAEAEGTIEAALTLLPNAADLLTHRAQLRQSSGDMDAAETDLTAALGSDPTCGAAFRAYTNGRKIAADDPIAAQLTQALEARNATGQNRADMLFAAAKAAFDRGDDAEVAAHLTQANALMAELFPYDAKADLAEARALAADWKTLASIETTTPNDPVLFVTGLPRSGTTLIETILDAHPDTSAGGEMPFLNRALAPMYEALRADTSFSPTALGDRYLTAARRPVPKGIIIDKAISTFSRIGHAARALPGAKFILVDRDPRDTGLSLFRNRFPDGAHRYAYDLQAMGAYIRLHDALTAFWKSQLPDRIHTVSYEALTTDPEPNIRAMLEFAGLDWHPSCLAPETTGRRIRTLSVAQARGQITSGSVAGWQRFEDMLAPLLTALDAPAPDLSATKP